MAFASVVTEETQTISLNDLKIIVSLLFCILFAFMNNFHEVKSLSIIFLILSCIASLYAIKIAFYDGKVSDVFFVDNKKLYISHERFEKGEKKYYLVIKK